MSKKAAKKKEVPTSIHQLKIVLQDSNPPIWRRVLVDSETTLDTLHCIIQGVMGWDDDHIHFFTIKKIQYGDDDSGDEPEYEASLNQVTSRPKIKFLYIYDIGDNWVHEVTVEKILPAESGQLYPVCTDGAMACPPEDCGGIGGYYHRLEILRAPENENYHDTVDWFGDDYNPEHFDLNEINKNLEYLK